ncbi:hypothetical protein [Hymenobacter pini]|uniref:hypothetical protein n=1 Tax=Hymenobacter pini TaxID=2880879 RepID=UPI001CF39EE8|nr:hypothetical protein [Hymenobacter pini]MCA8830514.1 hypothetical protein [Hymenobacter pini]
MEQADILSKVYYLVGAVGGIGVILIGASVFISSLVQQKLIYRLQSQNNREIEDIKAIIAQNNTFISSLNSNHSAVYQKLQAKRLEVVDEYWKCILKSKNSIPGCVYLMHRVLNDKELTDVEQIGRSKSWGRDLSSLSTIEVNQIIFEATNPIDYQKPFISSTLWTLKYAYGSIIGRTTYQLIDGYQKGEIKPWKEDKLINQSMSLVLSAEEINSIKAMPYGGVNYMLELLENKMVDEIQRFISNDDFIKDSADQFKRITQLIGHNPNINS